MSVLLDPDAEIDGPILHGDPLISTYSDDDEVEFLDDVSADPPADDDVAAWTVDTGCGEIIAPVRLSQSLL
jgi:hypothetical protein